MPRLKLFAGISIETDDGPLSGRAVQRRRLALLALLGVARAGGATRDRLIALLWPDADADSGRRFLSDSVYRINKALGGDVILAVGDELRLDPSRLPSDVAEFEAALERGEHEAAVRLYAGPLLDGFHLSEAPELERWIEGERERLARSHAEALESLAASAERAGDHAAAAAWWRRLAAQDPLSSRVALRLMRALDAAGDRAAAIQHARVHEALLRQELEIGPDPAVQQLAERLRNEPAPPRVAPAAPGPPPAELSTVPMAEELSPRPSPLPPPPSLRAPRRPRWWRTAAVIPVLVALVLWIGSRRDQGASAADHPPERSVAVLPFANVGGEVGDEYYSDGMTEELIASLGRMADLRVASRTSVFTYKNRPADVREIGRRLGVAAVVEGSVRKTGGRLRVTAQLVSTKTGFDLWSEAYERELADVFDIQQEIASAVARRLGAATTENVTLASGSMRDPEAYDLYLKGRFAWHRRSREGSQQAIAFFERAVARAPDYARAYMGLADAYAVSAFYDFLRPRDAYPKAEAAARRALALDPTLAAPHATLGYVNTYYHLDWARAEENFDRALAADPTYSTAHQWKGNLFTVSARFAEAERAFRDAQETDPLSIIANAALGWSFFHAGRFDDAIEQCRRALALDPDFQLAHLWGGMAFDQLGRSEDARAWIGRAVQLSGGSALTRLALAHALARAGSPPARDSARAIVRAIEAAAARGEYVPSYEIATAHLALGDREASLRWLERTVEERSHSRALFGVDPQLAPLRSEPRFAALLASLKRRP